MRRTLFAVVVAGCLAATACTGGSGTTSDGATTPTRSPSTPTGRPAQGSPSRLRAALAKWRLPAARSREVVLPLPSGLAVAGGLDAAQVSTSTVWLLDPHSGRVRASGHLAAAVHDAAGFVLGGRAYVVAGGNTTTVADVQRLRLPGTASVVGRLPQPRSDLVAVSAGRTAYVAGGFDGVTSLAPVLRTGDGRRFVAAGRLKETVRYPAMALARGALWLFGGEHNGVTTDVVQRVDLATGRVRLAGRLPQPLAHEAAFVLDGTVWLAGGRSRLQLQRRIWRWNFTTGHAVAAGHLPYAVADAGAAVDGSTAYLVGGETPTPTDNVVVLRVP